MDEDILSQRCTPFDDIFRLFRKLVRPLRLHSELLSKATYSNPWENSDADCKRGRISLERYMGDVLTLTFLLNSSDLGIVEGRVRTNHILRLSQHKEQASPEKVGEDTLNYRQWVGMHSLILRTKSFQHDDLGIPPEFCEVLVSEMIPINCCVSESFLSSTLSLMFYDFGRLGPAFRGRDVLQVQELPGRCLFSSFISDSVHLGETTRTAFRWLAHAHAQVTMARPMTVSPPAVRLHR